MNALFYALITEERLDLLSLLLASGSAMSVQAVTAYSPLHQSVIQYHMTVLYQSGLLDIIPVGRTLTYGVRHKEQVKKLLDAAMVICK